MNNINLYPLICFFSELLVLLASVKTRWNSFWEAIERFIELKAALELFWSKYCQDYKLTAEEWTILEELRDAMGPLYAATLELSSEKHTSISKIIPLTNRLKNIYERNYKHI